ncbi:hypothetical protein [Radiobacillus sp. PE A8.2]|uniref:hypothetical protein n=1 Tax=Radiobacillus sp. PE A8.2 TaxID=3380349 RepID=UPI00388EE5B9
MQLPSIDVGLMTEHLATHKGVIHKLRNYYNQVNDPYLKILIYAQIIIMEDHVKVMLTLLDPSHNQWVQVIPLEQVFQQLNVNQIQPVKEGSDKAITLEVHSTSKLLANDNFTSASMMKNDNVKQVHYDMAMQQANFEKLYSDYIKNRNWSVTTRAGKDEQLKVISHFQDMFEN